MQYPALLKASCRWQRCRKNIGLPDPPFLPDSSSTLTNDDPVIFFSLDLPFDRSFHHISHNSIYSLDLLIHYKDITLWTVAARFRSPYVFQSLCVLNGHNILVQIRSRLLTILIQCSLTDKASPLLCSILPYQKLAADDKGVEFFSPLICHLLIPSITFLTIPPIPLTF